MESIPLIFWLVLTISGSGPGNGTAMTIHPVPFGSMDDCVTAAEQFEGMADTKYGTSCFQQRLSDFEIMTNANGSYGWRDYPQQR